MFSSSKNVLEMFFDVAYTSPQQIAIELEDQTLTYSELLASVTYVAHHLQIEIGQIVCQYIDRSLEMVCGLLGIMCAGGVYCPLSLADSSIRIRSVLDNVQGEIVLVHGNTRQRFVSIDSQGIQLIDLSNILSMSLMTEDIDQKEIFIKSRSQSFIICTSGTTGVPKAIVHTHRSLAESIRTLINWKVEHGEKVLQLTASSWIIHIYEIFMSLSVFPSSTLVLLRPGDNLNMDRLASIIKDKQATVLLIGSSLLKVFINYLEARNSKPKETLGQVRILWTAGETSDSRYLAKVKFFASQIRLFIAFGMSETNTAIGCEIKQNADELVSSEALPIGYPLADYRCLLVKEADGQIISPSSAALFQCYYNNAELTRNSRVTINNEEFFKTGDLARYNVQGQLVHAGRADFQIKLSGQRIEAGEIEKTILSYSNSISNCIVTKITNEQNSFEYLVAYIQSSMLHMDEIKLREHCHARLRSYMVPSAFIVLEQFPIGSNGKVDRKTLTMIKSEIKDYVPPDSQLEMHIMEICRASLNVAHIGLNDNIFLLGAHSIYVNQIKSKITDSLNINLPIQIFYENPIISMLVAHCKKYLAEEQYRDNRFVLSGLLKNDPSARYRPFSTTEIQQAYLFGRSAYVELGQVSCFSYQEYDCSPAFDVKRFEEAINMLIQRHDTLRIIFPSEMEQQTLEHVPPYNLAVIDLRKVEYAEEQLLERRKQLSHQVRPADQWPLFDIQLTRFIADGEDRCRLHVGFDLLILDLWSLHLIFKELSELYSNPNTNLTPLNLSYRDYIMAENQIKNMSVYKKDEMYWINRLASFPLGPQLPLRCWPNDLKEQRFTRLKRKVEMLVWQKLKQRVVDLHLSSAGCLASVYAIILSKWSENKHFSLNLPIFNRLPMHSQVNYIAGDCTSLTALEINLNKPIVFSQFVRTVQNQLWEDSDHRSYSGVSYIRDLMRHTNTRSVVLPIVFTCGIDIQNYSPTNGDDMFDNQISTVYSISQTPQVYLDNQVYEQKGELIIIWDYVEDLFPPGMIENMLQVYTDFLYELALFDESWHKISFTSLPLDQTQRRYSFNETMWKPKFSSDLLHKMIIEQAERSPNAWAILSPHGSLTFEQLMNRVYSLAYHLQQQGGQPNQLIAILMRKGWEQVVACLAILVAGAAYLPLDIDSPQDRLCALIEETNVKIILTQSHCHHAIPHLVTIPVDTFTFDDYPKPFPIRQQQLTDLAYVIYTSGSTGKPKGVMISHQAVLNTILDINTRLNLTSNDRIFALSHLNFDLSVYDIFGMLIAGGTIVIPDHEHYRNPQHWYDMMVQHHVTIWNSVPMLMQMLVEHLQHTSNYNQLRHVLLSGDWIPLSLPKSIQTIFGEEVTITSLGGATEASIWSIAFTLPKEIPQEWKSIPYGMPLRNQQYYVYDTNLDDCPEWVDGELYIGGIGVADGYWNDEEKTRSSFIIHPQNGQRLYRTGDYGRFHPDGYIEFIGRKDFQVKIHGHRIELGEIEYHLQQHSDIHQAIVTVDKSSQYLIGYIMPEKYFISNDDFDQSNILITDPIDRTNFKLARHGIQHDHEVKKSYALTKPKLTETFINTYYARKSYRQFTNEIIEKSTIEHLLNKCCLTKKNVNQRFLQSFNFDNLSQLLSILTPINIYNHPLPKYRYASAGSLYPVQVYIELHTSIDDISPGIYYHNPDTHTLELIDNCVHDENLGIRLHLVGRSSAIAPLYGKTLGCQFCIIETGYMMGLLQQEASKLGFIFSRFMHNEEIDGHIINLDENDTHHCFTISSVQQDIANDSDYLQYIVYLKSVDYNKDQWFIYDKKDSTLISFDIELDVIKEDVPLFLGDHDDTKIIFNDCQCAIFYIGQSEHGLQAGMTSHLLMDGGLEMNIGMCPIGTRTNLPVKINKTLDNILTYCGSNKGNMLLHIMFMGKIRDEQKYERAISTVKSTPDYIDTLRTYLRENLPSYMIPSYFMTLSTFPLSPNGKIDRKSLPEISTFDLQKEDTYIAPTTELEKTIADIWQVLFDRDRISLTDNFFELGGNSLFVIRLKSQIEQILKINLPLHIFYRNPVLSSLVYRCKNERIKQSHSNIDKVAISVTTDEMHRYKPFPLRDIQQMYLIGRSGFIQLSDVSGFGYVEYDSPPIDIERFERTFNRLIQRHEALRLVFPSESEQQILEHVPYYKIPIIDIRKQPVVDIYEELERRRRLLSHQILPASKWPLFDIQITQWTDRDFRLHLGFDILIFDWFSYNIMWQELLFLYENESITLPTPTLSFRDYVLAEKEIQNTSAYRNDEEYWLSRLSSFPSGPDLPLKSLPNDIESQQFVRISGTLDDQTWHKLKLKIRQYEISSAGFLATIFALVLSKWSKNHHFTLNMPFFNRLPIHHHINNILGDFTSIILLEINTETGTPIAIIDQIRTVQMQLWEDLDHVLYSTVTFINKVMHIRASRQILFPIVFTCGIDVKDGIRRTSSSGIQTIFPDEPTYAVSQTPQVYLDNRVYEDDMGHLVIEWDYIDALFPSGLINDMHNVFINIIVDLATLDHTWLQPLTSVLPIDHQERRLLFNQTNHPLNIELPRIRSLIADQAYQTPDAWAILSSTESLTYKQLMNRVYSLAYHLQQQGGQPNQLIAILMRKGWEQVVACLAILVAGAAYLPLDIDSPQDRLCALIEETNVKIILTQSHCHHAIPHLVTIPVDTFTFDDYPKPFPIRQQQLTDLAYVIYTSGSTGKPKGVMISHQAVLNTILDINTRLNLTSNDRIFALSHLNFDLSVYDIFGMLIAGGTIVIPDHEHYRNPQHWYDMMVQHHVTIWNSVPMLMQMLVEHLQHTSNYNQLRHVLLSGDWIPLSLPKSIQTIFGEEVTITSLGGATEASIWSIAFTLPKEIPQEWKSIPYGMPLRNQQYYVYDTNLDDCPEWVDGELYIGGIGVADGYWNDEEKTRSSFIIHPQNGQRLYRTGDYGRFHPDGYIEFIGRKDFQVKIHGHRIELGEIEYHLQQHSDIHQAIVTVDKSSQYLIGYIMPEKHSVINDDYNEAEISITDPIERTNFKLARHGIQHDYEVKKSYALTKPKLTETFINTYYARKSYRQFTNEIIEKSTIEHLLNKCCLTKKNVNQRFLQSFNFDNLSQLLSILTPINIYNHPLPKYRYASAGSLYPVQVYIELHTSIDDISPGIYYHNPDTHTLELIDNCVHDENLGIRLHLVGRSSAIAPLYGKTLGCQFCIIETGYMMGLLQQEASKLGFIFSRFMHNEEIDGHIINLDENDTHHCFTISSVQQDIANDSDYLQYIVYLKSVDYNKDQWFIYDKKDSTLISFDIELDVIKEDVPLFLGDHDDTKIIFNDCQCAIFYIGQSEHGLQAGMTSHLLMDGGLEMNIGMCPIGTRTNLPVKINKTLDNILTYCGSNKGNMLLHIMFMGKIRDEQKYERAISTVKSTPDYIDTLRTYLRENLPSYMIPSYFMTLSTFPLSPNGKIDRKSLPEISTFDLQKEDTYIAPTTELEKTIADIWRGLLNTNRPGAYYIQSKSDGSKQATGIACNEISSTGICSSELWQLDTELFPRISAATSFFSAGGNSLLLIYLYREYQALFNFDNEVLSMRSFFQYNTVAEHAKLLQTVVVYNKEKKQWRKLYLSEGTASFGQERIFVDEEVRFSRKVGIYNELSALRIVQGSLSVDRLSRALQSLLSKHKILRTSLIYDYNGNTLKQHITNNHQRSLLVDHRNYKNDSELFDIINEMAVNPSLFDLSSGRVFHCEVLRQQKLGSQNRDSQLIVKSDILIIAFHHSACDWLSAEIFCKELCVAYNNNTLMSTVEASLDYIDYAVHERLIDMTSSLDRHRLSTERRSGLASIAEISLEKEISRLFLDYASSHQVTPFLSGLAIFYTFLFQLTYGRTDLCISCLDANRYRSELQNMIGMFVSTLPYRLQLNPHCSFDELVKHVQENRLSILEHSHYPLQHILADFHVNQSNASFLDIMFDFITVSSDIDHLAFNGVHLGQVTMKQSREMAKFDFKLTFIYNSTSDDAPLSCRFVCSRDRFDETTVETMARRLQYLVQHLFSSNSITSQIDTCLTPIAKIDLILPNETEEMKNIVFSRQSDVVNEGMYIHVDFGSIRLV
ncbi:hypothetical protein I4U23_000002 [Adineta vaga]|nr:hypothetical protein I4U23_000002 [Adineta vaga]